MVISHASHGLRPSSHGGVRFNNPLIIKKKRVKSTRPGGIRGGVLIQDKYSTNTPSKKTRLGSIKKFVRGQSSAKMIGESTNAGEQSSALYKSYGPTSMVKIGTKSV